jgi:hypothetical protein
MPGISADGCWPIASPVSAKTANRTMMKTSNPFFFLGFKDSLDVLDGLVLFDAVADQSPDDALLTQDIVLRVGVYHRGVVLVNVHGSSS